MPSTMHLGRLAGVEMGAHWTWPLVVALIGWSLADRVFPDVDPGLSDGTYVAMGAVSAALLIGCVLVHVLVHIAAARREGLRIAAITLWAFGGAERFAGDPSSPRAELRVAVVELAASLVFGAALLGLALAAPLPAAVDGVAHWLGLMNLALVGFNLLPVLPLNGGRVLRDALWAAQGDYVAATRRAAAAGRLIGRAVIGGGLAVAVVGDAFAGLWISLVGWLLLTGVDGEPAAAERRTVLGDLRAGDVMVRHPVVVSPDLALDQFMDEVFLRHGFTSYPVVDGTAPVGLISFRAVAPLTPARRRRMRVGEVMAPLRRVCVVDSRLPLDVACDAVMASPLRRAVVVQDGRLDGLLTATDLLPRLATAGPGEEREAA